MILGNNFKKNGLKQGIDMKLLAGDLPTGVASTFISPDGERTFGTYLGAAATMKAENLTLDMFKGYAYLYIEGYLVQDHELILRAMQLGKEAGLQICLDMASYNIVEGDLEFFDILITNTWILFLLMRKRQRLIQARMLGGLLMKLLLNAVL